MKHYVLEPDGSVREAELLEWAKFFKDSRRILSVSYIAPHIRVSTVFIGLGEDELFETMIFGGGQDGYQVRHDTHRDAMWGHERALWRAVAHLPPEATIYPGFVRGDGN